MDIWYRHHKIPSSFVDNNIQLSNKWIDGFFKLSCQTEHEREEKDFHNSHFFACYTDV